MDWNSITAGQTDAKSPLDQALFAALRGNLDFLYAREQVLLALGGYAPENNGSPKYHIESFYPAGLATGAGGKVIFKDMKIYVPSGYAKLAVKLFAKTGNSAAVMRVTVGAAYVDFTGFSSTYGWSAEGEIASPGSGWLDVSVTAIYNVSGGTALYMAGLAINTKS